MIITRKHLSRRTFLHGSGVAIALPFLDAMHPALTAERLTAAAPVRRLLIIEYPHGVIDDTWNPVGEGANYKMSDGLSPLERHREKFIVIRGLTSSPDRKKVDFHDRAIRTILTGVEPVMDSGAYSMRSVGVSMDQVAAAEFGKQTPFASLELATEPIMLDFYMCYKDPTTPLPPERNPRLLFERLFGEDATFNPAAQARRAADDASILDGVTGRIAELNRAVGAPDRRKLDQYFESIRDIERRTSIASAAPRANLPDLARPPGIPDNWADHVKLMFDLEMVALQADLTRVITFQMAAEASVMTFPQIGISGLFHTISHHNYRKENLDALSKINKHFSDLFAYFLDKLESVKEPGGSLLDHSLVLYGSSLSNSQIHSQRDLPIIVAGGAAGRVKGGRFIRLPGVETPLTNLHVALLDKVGVPIDKFGDSTGTLNILEI